MDRHTPSRKLKMIHLKTKPRFPLLFAVCLLLCAVELPAKAFHPPSPKPLSKNDIIDLLKGEVPSARVSELARENGINFQLTPAVEDELRHAGATNELLATLRDLAPKAPGIQIEITPGDAEVYVDDERVGKTSAEGRLKITKLAPGEHRIRVSLNGYKDFERTINLKGGETSNLTTQLQKSGSESISGNQSDTLGGNVPALLNKVVKAMGGKEKLKTIRSFRLKGNVVLYLQQ